MTRPPCIDDPAACQPNDCWCARWAGAAVPLPVDDEPEPEPQPRPIRDVPTRGLL